MNRRRRGISLAFLLALAAAAGCREETKTMQRDINAVKDAHAPEIMTLPGVVGIYVGEMPDRTPCIVIMVARKTRMLERTLPAVLEGYRVRIEESGPIRPMN